MDQLSGRERTAGKVATTATAQGKPSAMVTIEPRGPASDGARQHVIELELVLREDDDQPGIVTLAQEALAAFTPAPGTRAAFAEIVVKTGARASGIAGGVVIDAPPDAQAVADLRARLAAAGCSVSVEESRECSQCTATAMVAFARPAPTPPGWHDAIICGKHHYKRCASCGAVYVMSCDNVSGPAPSLHCAVCATVLVEWGGTKRWYAELVSRG
jgi:hypothetical protein